MTVQDLIDFLRTQPSDLQVAIRMFSEQSLLESCDLEIVELCKPRADGWIQNKRPDMETQKYLLFPGN